MLESNVLLCKIFFHTNLLNVLKIQTVINSHFLIIILIIIFNNNI